MGEGRLAGAVSVTRLPGKGQPFSVLNEKANIAPDACWGEARPVAADAAAIRWAILGRYGLSVTH